MVVAAQVTAQAHIIRAHPRAAAHGAQAAAHLAAAVQAAEHAQAAVAVADTDTFKTGQISY